MFLWSYGRRWLSVCPQRWKLWGAHSLNVPQMCGGATRVSEKTHVSCIQVHCSIERPRVGNYGPQKFVSIPVSIFQQFLILLYSIINSNLYQNWLTFFYGLSKGTLNIIRIMLINVYRKLHIHKSYRLQFFSSKSVNIRL